MKIITISLTEDIFKLLNIIVEQDFAPNRSEAVRRLLGYAIPRFIEIHKTYKSIINNKTKIPRFEEPLYERLTLEELREIYPQIPDYKHINEEMVQIKCQ
ncbi:hypothetical protein LCGC14_2639910 [marine sediment metagenome]|uniref:Uncharacterized protein n=1 Tax=marine sediment metagenome TaxID=412755 RepID=A0A0F9C8J5_9ZZZZ